MLLRFETPMRVIGVKNRGQILTFCFRPFVKLGEGWAKCQRILRVRPTIKSLVYTFVGPLSAVWVKYKEEKGDRNEGRTETEHKGLPIVPRLADIRRAGYSNSSQHRSSLQ